MNMKPPGILGPASFKGESERLLCLAWRAATAAPPPIGEIAGICMMRCGWSAGRRWLIHGDMTRPLPVAPLEVSEE